MIIIIATLFLGVLVRIALLIFRDFQEDVDSNVRQQETEGQETQSNISQKHITKKQMSMDEKISGQDTEENEDDKGSENESVSDSNSSDDENSTQDSTKNNNPMDKELGLVYERSLISETTNKEKEKGKGCKDVETDDRATEVLLNVLKILNLTKKYPGRLSREDMYQITKCSLFDDLPKCQGELASYFIHKIAKYDYNARQFCIFKEHKQSSTLQTCNQSSYRQKMNIRADEKRELDVSPMDVIISTFLCCDNICRQDLVTHMWSCRLAIPFVIQDKAPPLLPSCFLWPLRNLTMKWQTNINGNINVREGRLVKESFPSVAFIRVGTIGLSKSALINSVISATEKTHSIFFNRDSPGSTKHRHLVDGLIDIGWYFPTPKSEGKVTDHFEDAVMFLNLHGDAVTFQSHIPVLSKLANIITVLSKVEYLGSCRHIIQSCLDSGNTVLVVLANQVIGRNDEVTIDNFTAGLKAAANRLEYIEVVDKQRAEFVQETRSLLMKLVQGKTVCLENACSSDTYVIVDINTDIFMKAKKRAHDISALLQKTEHEKRKSSFFPLQGKPWINWAAADKEKLRTTYREKNEDVQLYMAKREQVMKECREEQVEILKRGGKQELVKAFLNSVSTSNRKSRALFLRWLKFEIDDLSREDLKEVYQEYHIIMQRLTKAEESEKETLKSKLEDLDKEVAARSIGLEHIMREIGQIFESLHEVGFQHWLLKYDLPNLAANILLDGYPVELLDGYVNAVPIKWVKGILRQLDNILTEKHKRTPRIKVITALGIQSSGKSTLLNALFGCQYAVSAGRCTRGVYCQLIKIEETYSKQLEIDYILAIDTEGLRAPELSASGQMVKHDNELSTFVIGLGDLTILNLMGENTTYLDELLPISVHAFLRMEETTKFRPKCIIVHQNVNKEDKQKLLQQGRLLEDTLDKMTKMACKVERTNHKSFKDIIEFDVSNDVYYLPALLEGSQPMAPISRRYSEELNLLKQNLVKKKLGKLNNTMASFVQHLKHLWLAIKRDDFVYQFRNTIETEARNKLDEYWCEANWEFRQPIHNILSTGHIQIQNTDDVNELEDLIKRLESKLREVITEEYLRQKDAFSTFISEADTVMKETMMIWSVGMNKRFDDLSSELLKEISDKLREYKQDRIRKFSLKDHKLKYQDTLRKNIKTLVQSVKSPSMQTLTEEEILLLFEDYWKLWKSNILKASPKGPTSIDIENDAFDALSRAFTSGTDALKKHKQMKPLSCYGIQDFSPSVLLTTWQSCTALIGISPRKQIKQLAKDLFQRVEVKLKDREQCLRPYSKVDIEEIVQNVKDHFLKNRKCILLQAKHEVYLAVIVCGHAIKQLRGFHEMYEIENSLDNLLEKEKVHCLRIFKALYNETETVDILETECLEILRNGIVHKMTHTLPDKIETDLRCKPFTLISKSMALYDHMIDMARDQSYEKFKLFIKHPRESITQYIYTRINQYEHQKENPIEKKFLITLKAIEEEVEKALSNSLLTSRSDLETWLTTFRAEMNNLIILENIDRLHALAEDRSFDLNIFFERVSNSFKSIVQNIKSEMDSYLKVNVEKIKSEVVSRILKNIIGCTESCPFCGAMCMIAHAGHDGEHYTSLHRPQGCNRWHRRDSLALVTNTCPENISLPDKHFIHYENGLEKPCFYKDYKTIYPEWKITADSTGDECSFWNLFFAKYAKQIAGEDLQVPDIPFSWKELTWQAEINKLEEKLYK